MQGSVAFVAGKLLQRKSSVCPTALNSVVNFVSSQQAVKEEGQDPDEIGIALEATSKKTKRFVKGIHFTFLLLGVATARELM